MVETVAEKPGPLGDGSGHETAGPARSVLTGTEFAAKYRECSRVLWCIAAGVVNDRSLADDVVQEAAMIALGKLDQFDPSTNFTAWAGQVVRFTALNTARKCNRERMLAAAIRETAGGGFSAGRAENAGHPPSALDAEAFDDDVRAALNELDETARECLLMKTTLDMAYADIARILSIPEGTAMSHVHRARKAMRTRLLAQGYPGGPAR